MEVINLFGGPGTGKSVMRARIYSALAMRQRSVEEVSEFAKELTWESRSSALKDQIYILGEQHHRFFRLKDKVDFVVCDSPFLLQLYYRTLCKDVPSSFDPLVVDLFNQYNNHNFVLKRTVPFDQNGRNQNLEQSIHIDNQIRSILHNNGILFTEIDPQDTNSIAQVLQQCL